MAFSLTIMRHAKSSWDNPDLDDYDRPLNPRGRRDAKRLGAYCAQQGLVPEIILASPAKRVRQTVSRFLKGAHSPNPQIVWDEDVYLGDLDALVDAVAKLRQLADNHGMLVGHNPGLESLLRYLCGNRDALHHHQKLMPTGACAHLRLARRTGRPGAGKSQVVSLIRPKQIR